MPDLTDGRDRVPAAWRWATLILVVVLLLTWGFLGYSVVDGAISLDHCRSARSGLQDDIDLLVRAGRGRLTREALLDAQQALHPDVGRKLEQDGTFLLYSGSLRFGNDGTIEALANP
jgi:hypothetical protein